jgi:hypothetical protein
MNAYMVRHVMAACAVAGSMLMVPSESKAIFHWFGGCNSCGTTANRPVAAAYAPYAAPVVANYSPCNTCSPCAQTCNYVPQTCYRTVYQQVPVTAYQPVSTCGPCGNQVTAMRPVITYQTQARLVPYTTYSPVYTPTVGYAPAATGCATGNCGSSVSYAAPMAPSSGCSSCGTSGAAPAYSSPVYSQPSATYQSTPSYQSAPSYQAAPTTQLGVPGSSVPSLPQSQNVPAPAENRSTFGNDGGVTEQPESRLRPIPDSSKQYDESSNKSTNSTLNPRLLQSDDRTTYRPTKSSVIPVSAEAAVATEGWRPARR